MAEPRNHEIDDGSALFIAQTHGSAYPSVQRYDLIPPDAQERPPPGRWVVLVHEEMKRAAYVAEVAEGSYKCEFGTYKAPTETSAALRYKF